MKLTIERDALLKALGHATAVVERRNTIPILNNVLIEAVGTSEARLVATDLDLQIRLKLTARVEQDGATTVAAHLLHGIARELAGGSQVSLEQPPGDGRLTVTSGRSRYQLQTLPRADFPVLEPEAEGQSLSVPVKALSSLLALTVHAQSQEPLVQPALCGVRVSFENGRLTLAATDRNRVAAASCEVTDESVPFAATLPSKFVAELQKLLPDQEGDVRLSVGARRVQASIANVELLGKLVEGDFLDWRRLLTLERDKRLVVRRDAFAAAVRRTVLVSNEKTRIVKVELARDRLTVSAVSPETGAAADEVSAVYDAADLTIGFNSRYLLDLLGAACSDEVQVDFADVSNTGALFTMPADASAHWVVTLARV